MADAGRLPKHLDVPFVFCDRTTVTYRQSKSAEKHLRGGHSTPSSLDSRAAGVTSGRSGGKPIVVVDDVLRIAMVM